MPFTSGFWAKFWVIGAAVDARSFWLALVAMITSVISAFVYLRIVLTMYGDDAEEGAPAASRSPVGARLASGPPWWPPSASAWSPVRCGTRPAPRSTPITAPVADTPGRAAAGS